MVIDKTIFLPNHPKPPKRAQINDKKYCKYHQIVHRPTKEYRALRGFSFKVANGHVEIPNSTQTFIDTQPFAHHHVHRITHDPRHQSITLEPQEREP